jgi:raffinose/stachyose/melibiose transport system permease protein
MTPGRREEQAFQSEKVVIIMQKALRKYWAVFTLPTLISFAIAFAVPFVLGLGLSFTKFSTVTDAYFVGMSNYFKAFSGDQTFLPALLRSVFFTIACVVLINLIAFIFALLLTRNVPGTNAFRTIFFMPNLIGGIVLGYIWQLIFNGVLGKYSLTLTSNGAYGVIGLIILMCWQMAGYMMVIYIAGLQNISTDVLEAAQIDGASAWKTLINVKLPMVMPSITICMFMTLTNSFKLFDQNLSLTNGAPGDASSLIALDIFKTFYARPGYEGVGQAKAVIFAVILAVVAYVQLRITRSKEVEN